MTFKAFVRNSGGARMMEIAKSIGVLGISSVVVKMVGDWAFVTSVSLTKLSLRNNVGD
ncbi:hypothetical protein Ddye_007490, partial [Dipteronia dyeriana]